eukprot:superscaffoldBa00003994_g18083
MTTTISNFIIKTLCDNQGCLDFKSLDEKIRQSFTVAEPVMRKVLFDDGKIALREARRSVSGSGQIISPDSLVVAKTTLRICQKKPGECAQCDSLHLCRYFVCGDCTFGNKCKNPHSLASPYNAELLKRWGFRDLTEKQLFQLLLQNDPYLLPEICPHYNKGNGVHGSCKFTTTCTKLHVCLHHFQGDCKFGSTCKRNHNIEAQGMKIFRGFSQETISNLPGIYRNKFIILGQHERQPSAVTVSPPVLPVKVPQPSKKPSHSNPGSPTSPTTPTTPTSPTSSAGATKTISDADRNEICLFFIRRHCSFKDKCARVHWHLPYRWQVLESDHLTWKDLPNMEDIEKAYCDPGQDTSCTDQASATLGIFGFLSLRSALSPSSSPSTAENVPSYWDKSALPDFGYKLIPLSTSAKEYKMIEMLFRRTMPQTKINSIQRIQNPSLWKVFQWQREQMKERSGGKPVDEKYLFHGTDESLIQAICEQNFDWRMCGVHGTAYGKGSYFARDASYSDRYARAKRSLNYIMFVALVLVGEYTKGSSSYVRPPSKGNSRTLYDSCVDRKRDPSIFVVFEKQQIYPEYIIDYS